MSKVTLTESAHVQNVIDECWKEPQSTSDWLPAEISLWTHEFHRIFAVPEHYLAVPILTIASHLSMHANVRVDEHHQEPILLYSLIGGGSGTNKTGALSIFNDMLDKIRSPLKFDTGSNDGLMLALQQNKGSVISTNDEFQNLLDNINTNSGNLERSRVLSLYNAKTWSKVTKTYGHVIVEDPRFTILGFTQNENVVKFGQDYTTDGFFQRYLVVMPKEVYIYRQEIKEAINSAKSVIDLQSVLGVLHENCTETDITVNLSEPAEYLYDEYYDQTVDFRRENRALCDEVSVVSKSRGLVLRVAGIVCLLRLSIAEYKRRQQLQSNEEIDDEITFSQSMITQKLSTTPPTNYFADLKISKEDMQMALTVVKHSVKISCTIMKKPEKKVAEKKKNAQANTTSLPIPDPENMTLDYLISNYAYTRSLCLQECVPVGKITRNKIYPHGEQMESGRVPAIRFLRGLEKLGLGKYSPSTDSFKRYNPNNEECPDRDELKKKWQKLNFD